MSRANQIRAGLIARGMAPHIADGFVMNFRDESGFDPGINEISPVVPGSRGGFGLAQWTGPRRTALEQFAASRGVPASDMNAQLDFLMTELQGPEAAAWQKISSAPDAGQAGASIVNHFLRPAETYRAQRAASYAGGQPGLMQQITGQAQHPGLMGAMMQDPLTQAMQGAGLDAQAPPETLKLFGWDTGVEQSKLQALADMQQPQQPMAQAPQIRTGPGYVKKTDGLARALEAFQATQAKRRA